MYLRVTRVKRTNGQVDEYIRLVESVWNHGSPRHRVICNLGRKELLAPHADALLRLLKGETKEPAAQAVGAWDTGVLCLSPVTCGGSWGWKPFWIASAGEGRSCRTGRWRW